MALVPDTPAAGAYARPPLSTIGLTPADIDSDKMDELVMRIFNELTRQMELLEDTGQKDAKEAAVRERDARILASLERTMERLAQVEAGRAAKRKSIAGMTDDQKRDLILRKLTVQATLERSAETQETGDW